MMVVIIPLTPEPQRFAITLGNTEYVLTVRWIEAPIFLPLARGGDGRRAGVAAAPNTESAAMSERDINEGGWALDIAKDETLLVGAIPLVTGVNLLSPYASLGFDGMLWVYAADDLPPDYDDLGGKNLLIFEARDDQP